ncbi:MAG TPA: TonB-dependent receptor [Gammaproteobacteria bacterium]|nr:TonB-dependent receptor [Gammaproteobacteria bacterium]
MKLLFNRRGVFTALVIATAVGAFGVSATAMAASKTSGGIYGEAPAGSTVIATNNGTGLTRQVTVGDDGRFSFSAVPIGNYTVRVEQNGNVTETGVVLVTINQSSHVNFAGNAQQLGTIQVVGGSVNPIDVTTSNTSLVLTSNQFEQLPVARDTNAVTLLAPSVINSSPRLGIETTSFGGASAAENAYYLNGLNVTDNLNIVAYSHPPFEALQEYQVLTGGLTAAYGSALGGVLNIVTKSGTNQFHVGANLFWEPAGLRAKRPDSLSVVPGDHTVLQYNQWNSADNQSNMAWNVYGSGPIIKDHLFFYALYQGNNFTGNDYTTSQLFHDESGDPQGLAKIDYQINDSNLLEVTAYSSKHGDDYTVYNLDHVNSLSHVNSKGNKYTNNSGGTAYIGRYTFVPTNNFNVSAMWGYVTFDHSQDSPTRDCPVVIDNRNAAGTALGCWSAQSYAGAADYDSRHQTRIDGEWQLGPHDITFGYNKQDFYSHVSTIYSGGEAWTYYKVPTSKTTTYGAVILGGLPTGSTYAEKRVFINGAEFHNDQHAFYLQDNWQIGNFYFRFGARSMSLSNQNGDGITFLEVSNKIAPRLGLSWDVFGDSSLKLYANAGRYYVPTSGDLNIRLAGAETDCYQSYTYTGMDSKTGAPTGAKQIGTGRFCQNGADGTSQNPTGVVSKNFTAMHEDEYILGAQQRIAGTQWSVGLRAIRRNLKSAIDDVCGFNPSAGLLAFTGYDNHIYKYVKAKAGKAAADAMPGCFLMNPGSDAVYTTPAGSDVTIPASVINVPKAERYYNAVEFKFDRAFDGKWFLHGSIVWSHLYGNEEGYTFSDIGQVDSGITELFDFPGLMEGSYGNLGNDATWQVKIFGAYQLAPEWRFGFNFHYRSGLPLSCRGYYAGPIAPNSIAVAYGSVSHYCLGKLHVQGTDGRGPRVYWADFSLSYMPNWAPGLTFSAAIINALNSQNATSVDLTAEVNPGVLDTSYLAPTSFQDPRYVRFAVQYDFM